VHDLKRKVGPENKGWVDKVISEEYMRFYENNDKGQIW
jgi:hypothetical protein